jgi:Tol biopolymer transport system component
VVASRLLAAISLLVFVAAGCGGGAHDSAPLATRTAAPIAFLRDSGTEESKTKLVIIDPDGSNERTMPVPRRFSVETFSWAPDGRRLVFSAYPPSGRPTIFVANADATGLHAIRRVPDFGSFPKWSPRGDVIAFDNQDDGYHAIWVIDADGRNARRLTPGHEFSNAVWSPDGRKIAYSLFNAGPRDWTYLMNADGTGKRKLTRLGILAWLRAGLFYWGAGGIGFIEPDGSPGGVVLHFGDEWQTAELARDGKAVALSRPVRPHGDWELAIATRDGVRRLTDNDREDINPSFAPDRKSLVFEGFRTSKKGESSAPAGDIYVINADGTGERNLTKTAASESHPSWAPEPR